MLTTLRSWLDRTRDFFSRHLADDSTDFNLVQFITTVFICGVGGGLISSLYLFILRGLVHLMWDIIFHGLDSIGMFGPHFPRYNFVWIGSLFFIIIVCVLMKIFPNAETGEFREAITTIHEEGKIPPRFVIPMFVFSLLSVSSGLGVGPEAPILVIGGGAASFVGEYLRLPKRALRIFSLSGTYASLSAFFGSPISGVHTLEFPHRIGMEFFEAFPTGVASSFVSSTILQLLFDHPFGYRFSVAESNVGEARPIHIFLALLFGLLSTVIVVAFWAVARSFRLFSGWAGLERFPYLQPLVAWAIFSVAAMLLPPIMFWGEPELQNYISRNMDPLEHWKGGSSGIIYLGETYSVSTVAIIGVVKMVVLAWAVVNNVKGGILFPLFAIGGIFGQVSHMLTGVDQGLAVGCMMASVQAGITRTPLASSLVTSFLFVEFSSVTLIPIAASCFFTYFLTTPIQLFPNQTKRGDIQHLDKVIAAMASTHFPPGPGDELDFSREGLEQAQAQAQPQAPATPSASAALQVEEDQRQQRADEADAAAVAKRERRERRERRRKERLERHGGEEKHPRTDGETEAETEGGARAEGEGEGEARRARRSKPKRETRRRHRSEQPGQEEGMGAMEMFPQDPSGKTLPAPASPATPSPSEPA